MAEAKRGSKVGGCIIVFVTLSFVLNDGFVDGRKIIAKNDLRLVYPKGTVKTTKIEDGDVIHCVDIYKQPAFDHLLLWNHTIQMKPSSISEGTKEEKLGKEVCPERTIPIIRLTMANWSKTLAGEMTNEYAQVVSAPKSSRIYGAQAFVNIWYPRTANGVSGSAQIWVVSGNDINHRNIIQAGWMARSPDPKTRLNIGWTRDGYQTTGCYNLDCPGFVQVSRKIYPGSSIEPVSTYDGMQYEVLMAIKKDVQTGNWWLKFDDEPVGYWPSSLFTSTNVGATYIYWGGEVETDMFSRERTCKGSCHTASESWRREAFFRHLGVFDENGITASPTNMAAHLSNPAMYNVRIPYPDYTRGFFLLRRLWMELKKQVNAAKVPGHHQRSKQCCSSFNNQNNSETTM